MYTSKTGPATATGGFSAVHLSALLDTETQEEVSGDDTLGARGRLTHEESGVTSSSHAVASNAMITAVAEQRDRFRAANVALEAGGGIEPLTPRLHPSCNL